MTNVAREIGIPWNSESTQAMYYGIRRPIIRELLSVRIKPNIE